MFLQVPELLHIELTSRCPLRCPQCYCDLTSTRDLSRDRLFTVLQEAAQLRVACIAFSGGEPLLYPYLMEAIKFLDERGVYSTLSTSGFGLTAEMVEDFERAGLSELWISLNGSNESIHNRSRDCFQESLQALKLLQQSSLVYGINWVARRDNAEDFPHVVTLAKRYGCRSITVLLLKPDSQMALQDALAGDAFFALAEYLKGYKGESLPVQVEGCYAYLKAYLNKDKFFRSHSGCDAGRRIMALSADGRFMPCRHLTCFEKVDSIKDYWKNSELVRRLREVDSMIEDPCNGCGLKKYCVSCRATAQKLHSNLYAGEKDCPVYSGKPSL